MMLKRIPFEEWGLKSVGPRRKGEEKVASGIEKGEERTDKVVALEWPKGLMGEEQVIGTLRQLGGPERQRFHSKWIWGSILGWPLTLPFVLLPM